MSHSNLQETHDIFKDNRQGECEEQLVSLNMKLVYYVIKSIGREANNEDDLVSEGYVGLLSAIRNFDHETGVKFSTYATHVIRNNLYSYLRKEAKHQLSDDCIVALDDDLTTLYSDTTIDYMDAHNKKISGDEKKALHKEMTVLLSVYRTAKLSVSNTIEEVVDKRIRVITLWYENEFATDGTAKALAEKEGIGGYFFYRSISDFKKVIKEKVNYNELGTCRSGCIK